MRVGVIGRGFGGRVVAPAFNAVEGCEVVEVISPRDPEAVGALCSRKDIDLISVHSPPFAHLDNVRRAIEAGRDVLCDKPFGANAVEAAEMRDLAKEAGVLHFLNFENRYDGTRRAIRSAVADGSVGTPEHMTNTALMSIARVPLRRTGWLFDAELGGGWLRAMGSHQIDFVRWVFGEIVDVGGQLRLAVRERPDKAGTMFPCTAEDGFVVTLTTAGGVSVVINSSSVAPVNVPASLHIVGSTGVLEEAGGRVVLRTADGERELFSPEVGANAMVAAEQRYAEVIRDAVRSRQSPPDAPTFGDGVACGAVMDRLGKPTLG